MSSGTQTNGSSAQKLGNSIPKNASSDPVATANGSGGNPAGRSPAQNTRPANETGSAINGGPGGSGNGVLPGDA